jgi:hypothetical protein
MNMGIGDGVDIGWKIAAALAGWGGPNLVASYEAERRPVHKAVIDEAVANFAIYVAPPPPEIEDEGSEGDAVRAKLGQAISASKGREFNTLGTVLGVGYEGSPIVSKEQGAPPPHDSENYSPSARPGFLAPHAWLDDGQSLYDMFGPDFTLLAAHDADPKEIERAVSDAKCLGIPLTVVKPDTIPVSQIYEAKIALIRPDQHVAWRGDNWDSSALTVATGRIAG